jgi:hypothetical protein
VVGEETSPTEKRVEIAATLLLGLAAFAAAWSGYQASLWDGEQSSNYSRASGLRTRASQQHLDANQHRLADLSVFENYLDAELLGETELAQFYRDRFRAEFRPAFDAWIAARPLTSDDAPYSPLGMPEYRLAADRDAKALAAEADARFEAGEDANSVSDTYVFTTLFFASVLFLAAVGERLEYFRLRIGLLGIASVALLVGIVLVADQPVMWGG